MSTPRHSKGTPVGGQFAASTKGEAAVSLSVAPGEDGETLVRRFGCENHDAPGECAEECVDLMAAMSGDEGVTFDETGTTYGPPRIYDTYEYDEETRASLIVSHVPEHEVLVTTVKPGQWVTVDGEPRRVDSMRPGDRPSDKVTVEFSGYDLDENGNPEGYFARSFRADTTFGKVYPDDIPAHLRHLS